jgi:phosphotransferase system HPr (HPr) family protein
MDPISSQQVVVLNRLGLHMRPADLLVRTASRFQSQIEIEKDGQAVDCKSILGILTLAAGQGAQLSLRACGVDAEEAVQALSELFAQSFHETDVEVASPPPTN